MLAIRKRLRPIRNGWPIHFPMAGRRSYRPVLSFTDPPCHGLRVVGESASGPYAHLPAGGSMSLLLGDLPGIELVELDSAGDVGDAGLAELAGGEVAGFLGLARAGPVRAVPDVEAGHEDLEQERGERVL